MTSALDRLPPRARKRLRPREQPEWTAPMLAVLTNQHFSDPGWIFERKLDGERCLAFRPGLELLGVAHRTCVDRARQRLEAQEVALPKELPRLLVDQVEEPAEPLP